jgi:hypothetical protein
VVMKPPPDSRPGKVPLKTDPPPGKVGVVEFTTVISEPTTFLSRPLVCVEVPAASESSTRIMATPTTIPDTVRAVLIFRCLRFLMAMLMDDVLDQLLMPGCALSLTATDESSRLSVRFIKEGLAGCSGSRAGLPTTNRTNPPMFNQAPSVQAINLSAASNINEPSATDAAPSARLLFPIDAS